MSAEPTPLPVSRTGATDREVEDFPVGTIARIHVSNDIGESWPIVERVPGGWQSGAHHYSDSDEPDDILVLAACAAAAPDSEQDVETLAQRLQQADPDGPYSALLDEPLEWDNEHTDREHYRKYAAALLAEQPGGGR